VRRKNLHKAFRYFLLTALVILVGCRLELVVVPAPTEVRIAAWQEDQRYIGMDYEWGGQDTPKGIDCSGLVVNCYAAAVSGIGYQLLFGDTTVSGLLEQYTVPVEVPEMGDLIFMGDGTINHVALYEMAENGKIWFVDAYSVSGYVEHRSYEADDSRFQGFGRLLVGRRR